MREELLGDCDEQGTLFEELKEQYTLGWDQKRMVGTHKSPIAFDTETNIVPDLRVTSPRFVLGSVSEGVNHYILRPEDLAPWILAHRDRHLVGHNFAFDFWVVVKELERQRALVHKPVTPIDVCNFENAFEDGLFFGEDLREATIMAATKAWWDMANADQFHDTMLLDMLVRLAEGVNIGDSDRLENRNLGVVAKAYAPQIEVNKEDPFRMRYGELLEIPTSEWAGKVEKGFFTYAITDAKATHAIYPRLYNKAKRLQDRHTPKPGQKHYVIYPDAWERFGALTEAIQVKGSIALLNATHNGMRFDQQKADKMEARLRTEVTDSLKYLKKNFEGMFTKLKDGTFKQQKRSHLPCMNANYLRGVLQHVAVANNFEAPKSSGKLGGISASAKQWTEFKDKDCFVESWINAAITSKLLSFFANFKNYPDGILRAIYEVLKKTGRTSCRRENLQQLPRLPEFREIFIASPGHHLVTIDYAAIELRTLATVCQHKLGYSKLAEVLRKSAPFDDPHSNTAALTMGVDQLKFLSWKNDPDPKIQLLFKTKRQAAKALSFGIPGGLGAEKLCAYAKANYSVVMSPDEAAELRKQILKDVYPEWNDHNGYLSGSSVLDLSRNLVICYGDLLEFLKGQYHDLDLMMRVFEKVIRGRPHKKDGTPYSESMIDKAWDVLDQLVAMSTGLEQRWKKQIKERRGDFLLSMRLFCSTACTLTGRVRAKVTYTQCRNTPFQSLAADGAKLAMWRLLYEGYKIVAFIHDELIVEVPEQNSEESAKKIEAILIEEMEKVLTGPGESASVVPVKCEYHVGPCWSK